MIIINISTSNAIARLSTDDSFDSFPETLDNSCMRLLSNCYYMGKYNLFTEDEIAYYDTLEPPRQKNLSFQELLEIFPGNKGVIKNKLMEEIRQWQDDLEEGERIKRETDRIIAVEGHPANDDWWRGVAYELYVRPLTEGREKMIKRNYFKLGLLKRKGDEEAVVGKITELDIEKAKSVPIENFIEMGRDRKALCLWHDDRRASLHIYPNNGFFCFVCSQSGDVIDVVMKLRGIGFLEAVKFLK